MPHRNVIALAFSVLTASAAQANGWRSFIEEPARFDRGRVIPNGLCTAHEDVFFTRSSHPGGNSKGRLNEDQDGRGMRCFVDEAKTFYLGLGTMVDSKHGDEFHFGFGSRYLTPAFYRFRLSVGGELSYVNYEIRNHVLLAIRGGKLSLQRDDPGAAPEFPLIHYTASDAKRGILPTLHLGIYYELGKDVRVGYTQIYLPRGVAKLTAFVSSACLGSNRSLMMSDRPFDGGPEHPLSGSSFPKQLFLCYRF